MIDPDKQILRVVQHEPGDGHPDFIFWCPGCQRGHGVWVTPGKNVHTDATWTFNGDLAKPTFTPSLRIQSPPKPECHVVVTDGVLYYCTDCGHALAGKIVPMEAF